MFRMENSIAQEALKDVEEELELLEDEAQKRDGTSMKYSSSGTVIALMVQAMIGVVAADSVFSFIVFRNTSCKIPWGSAILYTFRFSNYLSFQLYYLALRHFEKGKINKNSKFSICYDCTSEG